MFNPRWMWLILLLFSVQCSRDGHNKENPISPSGDIGVSVAEFAAKIAEDTGPSGIKIVFVNPHGDPIVPELVTTRMFVGDSLQSEYITNIADSLSNSFTIDVRDIPPTVGALFGDINFDGIVGFADFFLFADSFGSSTGDRLWNARADFDPDGTIGFQDFFMFADHFGNSIASGKIIAWPQEVVIAYIRQKYGGSAQEPSITERMYLSMFGSAVLEHLRSPAAKVVAESDIVRFEFFVEGYTVLSVELPEDFSGSAEIFVTLNKQHTAPDQILLSAGVDTTAQANLNSLFADSDDPLEYELEFDGAPIPSVSVVDSFLVFVPEELEAADFEAILTATDGAGYATETQVLLHRQATTFVFELTTRPDSIHVNGSYNLSEFSVLVQTFWDGELGSTREDVVVDEILGIPFEDETLVPDSEGTVTVTVVVGRARQDFELEILPALPVITYEFVVIAPDAVGVNEPFTVSAELVIYEDGVEINREEVTPGETTVFGGFAVVGAQTFTFHYNEFEDVVEIEVIFRAPGVRVKFTRYEYIKYNGFVTLRVDASSLEGVADTANVIATAEGREDIAFVVALNQSVDPTWRWGWFQFIPPVNSSKEEDVYWSVLAESVSESGLVGFGSLEVEQRAMASEPYCPSWKCGQDDGCGGICPPCPPPPPPPPPPSSGGGLSAQACVG